MSQTQKILDELTFKYRTSMSELLDEIESTLTQLTYHSQNEEVWGDLLRRVHSFTGSSGTFGFLEISHTAQKLEKNIAKLVGQRKVNRSELDQAWMIFGVLRAEVNKKQKELKGQLVSPECPLTFSSEHLQISPSNIFIVSDDEYFSEWLKNLLMEDSHTIHVVACPKKALSHKDLSKCDFIFSDVLLSEMSGYEFAKELRKQQNDRYIPIIFITSITGDMNRLECIKAGGDAVLNKPVSIEMVRAELFVLQRLIEQTSI